MGAVPVRSAGIALWRRDSAGAVAVLIGHMGGPFWARKDAAAWSFPKGEELGVDLPVVPGSLVELGEIRQSSGKRLTMWAAYGDLDPATVVPGTFTMTWPPRSGQTAEFPELDRVEWSPVEAAYQRLVAGQRPFLDRLLESLG
jgi:predicted NUDIX family NTP pyrophosphohydrolase